MLQDVMLNFGKLSFSLAQLNENEIIAGNNSFEKKNLFQISEHLHPILAFV